MGDNSKVLRAAQHLALSAAVSVLAAAGLTIGTARPAHAEFEIQEAGIEKGEVQLHIAARFIGAYWRGRRNHHSFRATSLRRSIV